VTIALVTFLAVPVFARDPNADRRKAETVARADKLLGQRYSPPTGKPLRLFDEQAETGPPDAVIYWHDASYVIELVFAPDGSVARLQLLPEELLHSDTWSDVPERVELSWAEMQSVVESANALQPLGKGEITDAPDGCFQSGQNLYCTDTYEFAVVSHYHRERADNEHVTNIALRDVTISYRQSVSGAVEDARVTLPQRIENESPATSGEDRRATGQTSTLLLAISGGRASESRNRQWFGAMLNRIALLPVWTVRTDRTAANSSKV